MLHDAPDTHAIHPPRRRGQTTNRRHRPAWRHHLLAHWRARTIRVIRPESCAPFPSHAPHPVCKQTVGRGRPTARGSRKSGVPRRRSWHQKDRGRLFPDPPLHLSSSALVLDRPQPTVMPTGSVKKKTKKRKRKNDVRVRLGLVALASPSRAPAIRPVGSRDTCIITQ